MTEELGFAELVDTSCDLIEAATSVGDALKDGFQITDFGTLLGIVPKVQELVKDGKIAVNELLDLSPEESERAAGAIAARTGHLPGVVIARVNEAFTLLARTHRQVKNVQLLVGDWARWGKSLRPSVAV